MKASLQPKREEREVGQLVSTVKLKNHSITHACCVIDKPVIENVHGGDTVVWDATQATANFKIVFPDNLIFGADVFFLSEGQSLEKSIASGLPSGTSQDYTIFCLETKKAVMSEGGVSPTIIIGD